MFVSTHRAAVAELIVAFRGRIANTAGDSVLAEFGSVADTAVELSFWDSDRSLAKSPCLRTRHGRTRGPAVSLIEREGSPP